VKISLACLWLPPFSLIFSCVVFL
jgi:hypothetical protein